MIFFLNEEETVKVSEMKLISTYYKETVYGHECLFKFIITVTSTATDIRYSDAESFRDLHLKTRFLI